jgi:FtsZ-interacting cell division protein ZipA
MSDLQIVLIVIGATIIAGVLIFNWWQERKFHRQIERNFSEFQSEVLQATSESAPVILDEISDKDEFSIDPHRFVDEEPIITTNPFNSASSNQELPADHIIQRAEIQDAAHFNPAEEDTIADSTLDESVKPIEPIHRINEIPQEETSVTERSVQLEAAKVIVQKTFLPTSVETLNEVEPETPKASDTPEPVAAQLPEMFHSQVDWAALLYLQGTASVEAVHTAIKTSFDSHDKPIFIHVETAQGWLLLSEVIEKVDVLSPPVSKICCTIQLADRAGPIAQSMLNRFQLAVETLGLDINAHVEWQNAGDALSDAAALDQFCIEVDKTMGFHLLHGENGAFTGTKLRGLAEAQGMQLDNDGTFKFYDAASQDNPFLQPQFVMFNRDDYPFNATMLRSSVVKSITFQLDIPHTNNCVEAFNTMLKTAKQMEIGLNAQLVDDNNRPLTDTHTEKIRHQLKTIQATMLSRGIAPGSACARRLFS